MNKIHIIGNLGRDPEMRYTASGNAVTNFSVAVSRNSKTPEGETREETEWFTVECWNKLGEIANQYLQKGRQVYIEGRVKLDTWDDRQSGEKRSRIKVTATDLTLLGQRGDADGSDRDRSVAPTTGDTEFDNMPF